MRVAVTGVGGGVGQSIMKALELAALPVEIYPVDVTPLSAGLYRGVEATVLPPAETPGALELWERWLLDKQIAAVIPGSDHDLIPLSLKREEWAARGVTSILVSDYELVRRCRDKALTVQLLQSLGLPAPRSIWDVTADEAAAWAEQNSYPVIIKPRSGSASRGLVLAHDEEELRFYLARTPQAVVQEYLQGVDEQSEYTCAVFCDRQGEPVTIFMARRDLAAGSTYRAEVKSYPELQPLLLDLGRALKPRGPLNIQLRLTARGPVPFELNIRCSGTTSIRAHFGYNEPEMLLRHYVLGEAIQPPQVRAGFAFRYWNEVFVEGADAQTLTEQPARWQGIVRGWP